VKKGGVHGVDVQPVVVSCDFLDVLAGSSLLVHSLVLRIPFYVLVCAVLDARNEVLPFLILVVNVVARHQVLQVAV